MVLKPYLRTKGVSSCAQTMSNRSAGYIDKLHNMKGEERRVGRGERERERERECVCVLGLGVKRVKYVYTMF